MPARHPARDAGAMALSSPRPAPSALGRLTLTELRLLIRERAALVFAVALPILLLVIFGAIPAFRKPVVNRLPGISILDAYVPILIAFVLAMMAISVLPATLAGYREKGVLRRLALTPVGPRRVLAAQLIVCTGMTVVTLALLLALARIAYHVPLPRQAAGFALAAALAVLALFSIGLLYAAVAATSKAANALGAITFFPLMFFAGLWLPVDDMPRLLRQISHATPLGAAVQALQDSWQGRWPHPVQLLTLAAYAIVFAIAAIRLFRWE
jgi:ABC-2 type transport system permease protein